MTELTWRSHPVDLMKYFIGRHGEPDSDAEAELRAYLDEEIEIACPHCLCHSAHQENLDHG